MENELQIINPGFSDDIEVLSDFEMSEIIGGSDIICKRGFMMSSTGTIACDCGYQVVMDPTPPPTNDDDIEKPDPPIGDFNKYC